MARGFQDRVRELRLCRGTQEEDSRARRYRKREVGRRHQGILGAQPAQVGQRARADSRSPHHRNQRTDRDRANPRGLSTGPKCPRNKYARPSALPLAVGAAQRELIQELRKRASTLSNDDLRNAVERVIGAHPSKRGYGRPKKFATENIEKALAMKQARRPNREIAAFLYATHSPTVQQAKNLYSIFKNYRKTRAANDRKNPIS
jgi:hypothetical protein